MMLIELVAKAFVGRLAERAGIPDTSLHIVKDEAASKENTEWLRVSADLEEKNGVVDQNSIERFLADAEEEFFKRWNSTSGIQMRLPPNEPVFGQVCVAARNGPFVVRGLLWMTRGVDGRLNPRIELDWVFAK